MAEILLFHHAQGLTPGVRAFADDIRAAGHIVHTPDLFDGRTFPSIEAGIAYIGEIELTPCGSAACASPTTCLPGSSMPGSRSVCCRRRSWRRRVPAPAGLCSSIPACRSAGWAFGPWPAGVAVQIHGMDNDPIFVGEGDIDAAREIVEKVEDAELFLYPGDQHYFADSSLPSYDADATALLTLRVIEFLNRV